MKKVKTLIAGAILVLSIGGCAMAEAETGETSLSDNAVVVSSTVNSDTTGENGNDAVNNDVSNRENTDEDDGIITPVEDSVLDVSDMFTNRDIEQVADLEEAEYISLENDTNYEIMDAGVYVLSGNVSDATIIIEADDEAKVQLVLDGVEIVNEEYPAIYVKSADKVYVTTTDTFNYMEVSGNYESDGDNNLDAVIYSKDDLVLNGLGTLEVLSVKENGITSKDDLKITGGTIIVTADADGLEANDSIRIYDGDISLVSNKDALHSENDDDASLGYIYMYNGSLTITADDDAIHANSIIQIDGGMITIDTCQEGIEATIVQINGGIIDIYALDDGINATALSTNDVIIEVNGGVIEVRMASGDTDGFDANGDITVNGGTINVEASSSFDADGNAVLNDGNVTINGEEVDELPASQQGGRKGK